ncbi:GPI ethanolamine phosphate transferase 1 [Episyrphus balteatus]|uniref:GPI ethanolamine phosphate transferase 1 n=1 Tax=Episyrphus balteatus TaxID=286459 RepID=UPI0024852E9C|nr:GPI ethanolamine phosphate transferase 1 [Episyrphus balteatus]
MWITHAILVHIALLGSIFVIYFRSPVITGLHPQKNLPNPPAKRLVLIVTDGLRAESFFKNQCADIPHIRQLIRSQGLVGISQTRVPTESRPGHIALIAGLYEDPSAVLRGWKANPIDFDNVFNRSEHTYAWGAMDVLHIFSKITAENTLMIDAYDEYDFSGKDNSSAVDQWVFERVKLFLNRRGESLQREEGVVFFLHLLGLDIAGHIHKPGSELFLETLHSTEKGVYEMYQIFEKTFPDQKTAYVLTSDHGMTNHGSHGAGDPLETETPFLVWGAGVNNWKEASKSQKTIEIDGITIPLINIEQGQAAPLMSSLIGLPPPMNSFGKLPKEVLNVSSEYMATASYTNALQLIAQFEALFKAFNQGAFSNYLPSFKALNEYSISQFRSKIEKIMKSSNFDQIIDDSFILMQKALDGIDYYHTYYQNVLLFCTSLSLFIWMFCLITFFVRGRPMTSVKIFTKPMILGLVLLIYIFLQKIPIEVGFYIILPVLIWALALQSSQGKQRWLKSLITRRNLTIILVVILGAILMVTSFFKREFITLVFLMFASLKLKSIAGKNIKFALWSGMSLILCTFPLLSDVMGQKNDILLLIGAVLTLTRGFLVKSNLPKWMYGIAIVGLLNAAFCVFKHNNLEPVPLICRIVSWFFLIHSLAAPFYVPSNSLKSQVEIVFFSLSTGYVLLCTSFEVIFVVLLGSQLMLSFSHKIERQTQLDSIRNDDDLAESFEYALAILLYTLFTFFGTGNTASVSSFDPNVMRCFITTFSPFIIMGLVILKLFLPMLLSVVIIYGTIGPMLNEEKVFIAMLFICDVMGLNFLFLVRNKGSWLEIGSSISHFVIMEATTLVLVATTYIVKMYLKMPLTRKPFAKIK